MSTTSKWPKDPESHWQTQIVYWVSQLLTKVYLFFVLFRNICSVFFFVSMSWIYSLNFSTILPAPQPSSKPSPSKRLCSGEKLIPAAGEENQEPQTGPVVPMLTDPPTDKKPPVGPSSRHSSLERAVKQLAPQPGHVNNVEPQPEMTPVPSTPKNQAQKVEKITPATPVPDTCKDDEVEVSASRPAGMRSRLHMLAEQRKCWDGNQKNIFIVSVNELMEIGWIKKKHFLEIITHKN